MKPETKKYIIAGVLGVISIAAALAYLQYRKLMNFTIKFKKVLVKTLSATSISFDLFLNFTNNSDIKFTILEQDYKVYMNDAFVTKIINKAPIEVISKGTSVIPVNVTFDPRAVLKLIGKNATDLLLNRDKIIVKMDIKLKVKLYGIPVSIPYVYTSNLKELTSASQPTTT